MISATAGALSFATIASIFTFVIATVVFIITIKVCFNFPRIVSSKLYAAFIGPLYVSSWVFYPVENKDLTAFSSMCSAGLVASLLGIGFLVRGSIETGLFLFGAAHIILALLFWQQPCAALASIFLSTGDAFAALAGAHARALPRVALPWNSDKTIAGVVGFVFSSLLVWAAVVRIYWWRGLWIGNSAGEELVQIFPSFFVTLLAALIESLPGQGRWDNLTVCLTPILYVYMGTANGV